MNEKGRNFFTSGRYQQAAETYYEAIMEVEELFENGSKRNPDINELEVKVRLNYARSKIRVK
jgi:hypothetical protein